MKSVKSLVIGAGLGLALAFSANAEITMKFSHVVAPTGNPKGEAAQALAQMVNERLAGKINMEVFPNSQLYNDDKVLEAMILGDAHLAAPSLSKFEKYSLAFRVFDLPFLFNDIEAVDRFQQGPVGQKILRSMEDKGFIGLGYWHNGMKQMSANKPLLSPDDAKGLKFRIQTSDVLQAQFEALGANPQKMAFSEVYGALQTGVVDGQENTWSNIYTKKFFEVQDGVTNSNHGVLDYLLVTSTDFWNGLDDDLRNELAAIIKEATMNANQSSGSLATSARAKIEESGGVIRTLTPAQRAQWVEVMKPVWSKFEADIGSDVIEAALASNN